MSEPIDVNELSVKDIAADLELLINGEVVAVEGGLAYDGRALYGTEILKITVTDKAGRDRSFELSFRETTP